MKTRATFNFLDVEETSRLVRSHGHRGCFYLPPRAQTVSVSTLEIAARWDVRTILVYSVSLEVKKSVLCTVCLAFTSAPF